MLGYKEEEILGKDISMIVPRLHDRVRHGIQQQFEGRIDVVHEESVRLNKAGENSRAAYPFPSEIIIVKL